MRPIIFSGNFFYENQGGGSGGFFRGIPSIPPALTAFKNRKFRRNLVTLKIINVFAQGYGSFFTQFLFTFYKITIIW